MFLTKEGGVFIPRTAEEIAEEILDDFNGQLSKSEIRTEGGEIVQVEKKSSNIAWLMFMALGGLISDYEFNLQSCAESFDFTLCTDEQLQNLLPLAGQSFSAGKKAIVHARGTNNSTEGGITIPAHSQIFTIGTHSLENDSDVEFPQATSDGATSVDFDLVAVDYGNIPTDQALDFTSPESTIDGIVLANIELSRRGVEQGVEPHSLEDGRQRILDYKQTNNSYVGVVEQIKQLDWVRDAFVVFNYSFTTALAVGEVSIQPRRGAIFIYGTQSGDGSDLASIWWNNELIETTQVTSGSLESKLSQYSNGLQTFNLWYIKCKEVPLYVKVKYITSSDVDKDSAKVYLSQQLLDYNSSLRLGYSVTSSFIDRAFNDEQVTVIDSLVSLDGTTYTDKVDVLPYQMPVISFDSISYEEVDNG